MFVEYGKRGWDAKVAKYGLKGAKELNGKSRRKKENSLSTGTVD